MNLSLNHVIKTVLPVVKRHPAICLAYIFGSVATNSAGPLSDYDFAFYFDNKNTNIIDLHLRLISEISLTLQTDKVDCLVLNNENISPEIKYAVISQGILFHELEAYKIIVETKILNEYFDYKKSLELNGIT
ncbi:MAG TPA: nucleotidyltransferase domain-containing protein [Oligoflexia bacterium]|nr:nucleotidyltransferase domain-containing protein [Oligoflexia bacterium]HMP47461.1 nucleotidyltransferase domain-containing protein [Oligoflexia bacterium]